MYPAHRAIQPSSSLSFDPERMPRQKLSTKSLCTVKSDYGVDCRWRHQTLQTHRGREAPRYVCLRQGVSRRLLNCDDPSGSHRFNQLVSLRLAQGYAILTLADPNSLSEDTYRRPIAAHRARAHDFDGFLHGIDLLRASGELGCFDGNRRAFPLIEGWHRKLNPLNNPQLPDELGPAEPHHHFVVNEYDRGYHQVPFPKLVQDRFVVIHITFLRYYSVTRKNLPRLIAEHSARLSENNHLLRQSIPFGVASL